MERKVAALTELLGAAVHEAIGNDRDVCALQLSGGLDSAVVQAFAHLDALYCCTWPEVDNISLAQLASCRHDVRPVTFTREEMIEVALPEVARITRGKGTWSQCCQWFMARQMKADGYKVVLNGEGSDELFGGYARYRILYWLDRIYNDPHLAEYQGIVSFILGARRDHFSAMVERTTNQRAAEEVTRMFYDPMRERPLTQNIGWHDEKCGLAELIGFERDVAAAHGVEHRWPFMNPMVVGFAHTLAEADKITETESKHILREVARKIGVPASIVNEQTKRGLFVPTEWRPADDPKWSRGWFDKLMADAWQKVQKQAA